MSLNGNVFFLLFIAFVGARFYDVCERDEDCKDIPGGGQCIKDDLSIYFHGKEIYRCLCPPPYLWSRLKKSCVRDNGTTCRYGEIFTDEQECTTMIGPGEVCLNFQACYHPIKNLTCHNAVCTETSLISSVNENATTLSKAFKCMHDNDCSFYAKGAICINVNVEGNRCLCPRGFTWNLKGDECIKIRPVYNLNDKCYTRTDCYVDQSYCHFSDTEIDIDEENNQYGKCVCRSETRFSKTHHKCLITRGLGEFCGTGELFECYEPNKNLTCHKSHCIEQDLIKLKEI